MKMILAKETMMSRLIAKSESLKSCCIFGITTAPWITRYRPPRTTKQLCIIFKCKVKSKKSYVNKKARDDFLTNCQRNNKESERNIHYIKLYG